MVRQPKSLKQGGLLRAFTFAFSGILYLFKTQRNARIQLLFALIAIALGFWLNIPREHWIVLVLTIALVLMAEALNTAIETIVDLISPEVHPLAKIAKDVSAGMVLIAAIGSAVVGILLFGPDLWHKFRQ